MDESLETQCVFRELFRVHCPQKKKWTWTLPNLNLSEV